MSQVEQPEVLNMEYDDFQGYEQHTDSRTDEQIRKLMESISQRGKGEYVCPLGQECRKGGWKDGVYVIFTRNSSFKSVEDIDETYVYQDEAKSVPDPTYRNTRRHIDVTCLGAPTRQVLLG